MLIPTRRRTGNPRGRTPIVRYNYQHDRISAIAALTVAAKRARWGLYVPLRQDNFKAVQVAKFLRLLLTPLRGHVILLWEGGQIHKGPAINAVRDAFPRLHLERFPGYAPELNPVEQVWNDFKRRAGNSILRGKQDIRLHGHGSARRVRRSPDQLRSFVLAPVCRQAGRTCHQRHGDRCSIAYAKVNSNIDSCLFSTLFSQFG